jgi:hypothetical protein
VGGCPLPPAQQRDLGVDEASKVGEAVRPGYASRSFWTLTGGPPAHDPPPWWPSHGLLTDRRPQPDAATDRALQTLR